MLIEMDGFAVKLQRKQIKNINLRIKKTGEVQVSAPMKTSIDLIHTFLAEKEIWIKKHRHHLLQHNVSSPDLTSGAKIQFKGETYPLFLHEIDTNERIEFNHSRFDFFVKQQSTFSQRALLFEKWCRLQMIQSCEPLFIRWKTILNVDSISLSIKKMKSRWGSCHPIKKHVTLNLKLIEKHPSCLEYVIVHELMHLFEPSHNHRFHALMTHYFPDWKVIKKQLF